MNTIICTFCPVVLIGMSTQGKFKEPIPNSWRIAGYVIVMQIKYLMRPENNRSSISHLNFHIYCCHVGTDIMKTRIAF